MCGNKHLSSHTYNTQSGGSGAQGHPQLHGESGASLSYMRFWRERRKDEGVMTSWVSCTSGIQDRFCALVCGSFHPKGASAGPGPEESRQGGERQDVSLGRRPRCPCHNCLWRCLNGSQEQPSGFLLSVPTPGGASLGSSVCKTTQGSPTPFSKHITQSKREGKKKKSKYPGFQQRRIYPIS